MSSTKTIITFPDFEKLDLRIGTVIDASLPDWSTKLIRYTVDFGNDIGMKTIFSGIRKWYTPDDLIGKQYIFVINLASKKMGDEESQGMMIMTNTEKRPILQPLQVVVPNGSVVC